MQELRVTLKSREQRYEIKIGRGLLGRAGLELRKALGPSARRVVIISNPLVFDLFGVELVAQLQKHDFTVKIWLMQDGERFKSLATAQNALSYLSECQFERTDSVISLGGGVVGDLAGFVAATYLRGVPFIQIPTTLISQIDAAIGGKTGVNLANGKNLIGAFHHPRMVLTDTETLRTLPPRELTAGWCEAVKHGAVSSRSLFNENKIFLEKLVNDPNKLALPALEKLIKSHCAFKASIVAGDEREAPDRADHRSRRILNFGHTTGHALEAVTRYRRFRHGEAVGHGMLVAGEISKNLGLLDSSELELLCDAVRLCGTLPKANDLDKAAIVRFIQRDKKSVAGRIKWVLLERIGRARIVDGKEITARLLRESLRVGLSKARTT